MHNLLSQYKKPKEYAKALSTDLGSSEYFLRKVVGGITCHATVIYYIFCIFKSTFVVVNGNTLC